MLTNLGKVVHTFVAGDGGLDNANQELKTAVDNFNNALYHYGHGVGFKTAESVEGILPTQSLLTTRNQKPPQLSQSQAKSHAISHPHAP